MTVAVIRALLSLSLGIVLFLQAGAMPQLPAAVKSEGTAAVLWLVALGLGFAMAMVRWVVMPILKAIQEATAAKVALTAVVEANIREAQEARRHLHAIRSGFVSWQLLALDLIRHLEGVRGMRLVDARELLHKAEEALQPREGEAAGLPPAKKP
jgi:hypothetical protein